MYKGCKLSLKSITRVDGVRIRQRLKNVQPGHLIFVLNQQTYQVQTSYCGYQRINSYPWLASMHHYFLLSTSIHNYSNPNGTSSWTTARCSIALTSNSIWTYRDKLQSNSLIPNTTLITLLPPPADYYHHPKNSYLTTETTKITSILKWNKRIGRHLILLDIEGLNQ